MGKTIAAMVAVLLGTGCATSHSAALYRENSTYDAAAGTHLASMHLNVLEPQEEEPGLLAFDAFRLQGPEGVEWTVDITYMAREWLFIRQGPSMSISVDGRTLSYTARERDPVRDQAVLSDDSILEQAIYPVSLADLTAIAQAKEVTIKVEGNRGVVSGRFSEANIQRLRTFLQHNGGEEH